ncbi:hypothetical protein [Pendulispora albinea]|uniref:Uncharacterized protein n=1 Tax=Pendulispora albinea TaxID=2741071 RepID=A0ABZ2LVS3_9BACT
MGSKGAVWRFANALLLVAMVLGTFAYGSHPIARYPTVETPFIDRDTFEGVSCPHLHPPPSDTFEWVPDAKLLEAGWPAEVERLEKMPYPTPTLSAGRGSTQPGYSYVRTETTSLGKLVALRAGTEYWYALHGAGWPGKVQAFRKDVAGFSAHFGEMRDGFAMASIVSGGTLVKLDERLRTVTERRGVSPGAVSQYLERDDGDGIYMIASRPDRVQVGHFRSDLRDVVPSTKFEVPSGSNMHFFLSAYGHSSDRHCIELDCSYETPQNPERRCSSRYLVLGKDLNPVMTDRMPLVPKKKVELLTTVFWVSVLVVLVLAVLSWRWKAIARAMDRGNIEGEISDPTAAEIALRTAEGLHVLARRQVRLLGFGGGGGAHGPCVIIGRIEKGASTAYRGGPFGFVPGARITVLRGNVAAAHEMIRARRDTLDHVLTTYGFVALAVLWVFR